MSSDPPKVRPGRPADLPAIRRIYERAFHRPLSEEAWQWKLGNGTFDDGESVGPATDAIDASPNVWVAVDANDDPIGHYGGFRRTIVLGDGKKMRVMVTGDTMTDPDHRRSGALLAMCEVAHAAWRDVGYACVLGLPNQRWGSRIQRLDWRLLYEMRWFLRPLEPAALLAERVGVSMLSKVPGLGGLYSTVFARGHHAATSKSGTRVEVVTEIDDRFDRLDPLRADALDADPLDGPGFAGDTGFAADHGLVRGGDWLAWRYRDNAFFDYEILEAIRDGRPVGYLSWRLDRAGALPFGTIAESVAIDEAAHGALLDAAIESMRARGAAAAAALAIPGNPDDRRLRRAGFRFSRGAFDVRCVPLIDDMPWDVLRNGLRFTLHGGDFDVA